MSDDLSNQPAAIRVPADGTSAVPELERLIHEQDSQLLIAAASDLRLTEDLALALLNRRDLPRQAVEALYKNSALNQHRKVRMAVVMHPHAPRHISVPAIRHLYTFELMEIALFPAVSADVKRAAEEVLIGRLATIASGERLSLAKRSSARVAAALLLDKEERVMQAALANPQMTEALVVKALKTGGGTPALVASVSRHDKWSHRNDVRAALLANEHTPFARVLKFAAELPRNTIREVLMNSRLQPNVKEYLHSILGQKTSR